MPRLRPLCLLLVVAAATARGQATFFPPGDWVFNPGAEHSQVLGTGDTLGPWQFRVGLLTHGLWTPLEGATPNVLQLREHLVAAVGLGTRVQVSAQLPALLVQEPLRLSAISIGRPWVAVRVGLLTREPDELTPVLALELAVGIPGLARGELDLASQHDVLGSLKLSAGFPAAHGGMFGLEVEGRASLTRVDLRGGATFVTGGLHLRGEFTARGEAWLNGGPRGFVELLAGVRYLLRPLELSLLTGPGYGLASQGFDYRLVLGVAFVSPSAEESDAARVASTDCTEGTDYKLDDCPDLDFDNDGVRNRVDRCPREFGERRNQGCPWPDTDGDTLVDHQDNCPKVPGPVENFGCPREQKQLVQIGRDKLEISERVFFEFNKAIIKPESFELLDQVAAVIENHPELRVRVEGHTDKVGSADYNHTLSLARAQAVKAYLTERGGISAGRLSVAGFGFDVPIATNDTDEGRARNRRVEFMFEDAEP